MTDQEKYAEKIAALLRKAESTTPEEAELLYGKAAELMAKYQISEAMLKAKQPKSRGEVKRETFVSVSIWRYPIADMKWRVAKAMGLEVIKLGNPSWYEVDGKVYKENEQYEMFGFPEDLEHFKMIITSLEVQMFRAELAWWRDNEALYSHETKSGQHKARRGFMFGFALGAASKYAEAGRKAKQAAEAEHGADSVALVLRDKSLEIKDVFKKAYPQTRNVTDRKSRGDAWAHGAGREAGRNADVGQTSIGGKSSPKGALGR